MEDEEGLILCHCSISDHNDDGEEEWEKSVKKYSDLISAAEIEPNRICNFGVCDICSRESTLGNQRKKTKEEKLSLAYNERGHLKYLLVNFDGAIEDYTKAIELYPNAITLYNRGQVYYRLGMHLILCKNYHEQAGAGLTIHI